MEKKSPLTSADWRSVWRAIRPVVAIAVAALSLNACGPKVEILQTTNISSKVAAIGGIPTSVRVLDVSGDGAVVVGQYASKKAQRDWQLFRYTQSGGIENLGSFGQNRIKGLGISADGAIIWGSAYYAKDDGSYVFRHTQLQGLQDLGTMGQKSVAPAAVSAGGSVIVGSFLYELTSENAPIHHAFRFSQAQGFEDLGAMGAATAFADGVSADGSVIVGHFSVAMGNSHAFRYSRAVGVTDIGAVGNDAAFATGISDGGVIVGTFVNDCSFFEYRCYWDVFVYTSSRKANESKWVRKMLSELGIELRGVKKLGKMGGISASTTRISADGAKFAGSYKDSAGESYVYIARVPPD